MDTHKNASLTPRGREAMASSVIEGGLSKRAAAHQFHTTPKTVAKWVGRFQAEGVAGLQDRRRPHSSPSQTTPAQCAAIEGLRRQRHTGEQIAAEVGVSGATVSRVLKRLGLNRLSALEPAEPVRRYERAAPGEILHIDIKKLGKFNRIGHRITGDRIGHSNTRGVGWEYVHLAIDDHSRLAYSEILPDEKRTSCLRFLFNALRFFRGLGVRVERVMTDNGSSFRSHRYAKALRRLKIKHLRTRPYTPRTNGKAERFVQTSLREWAYARAYNTSDERAAELPLWLHRYNWHRPHGSLGAKPPCMDAPVRARCFANGWSRDRVRSCIRPQMRLFHAAGRYGDARTRRRSIRRAFELVGFSCISWPGSDRSFALTVRRPPHAPDVPSAALSDRGSAPCSCRNPIIFAPRQHGPDRARHCVGACDGRHHPWLARQQAVQPASLWPALSGGQADDSHRADNQQAPDVALAHLRGLAEKRLAARRMLPGNKPEPGGKVAAASEDGHRRRESLNRHRGDRSHARHGLQAAHCRSARGFLNRRLLEFGDRVRQPVDRVEKDARELDDEKRKGRHFRPDGLCKALQVRWSLRHDDAMLGQVTAERIDQLRALANQKIPGAKQHGARLLLLGLDRHEAHGWPDCRLMRWLLRPPRRSSGA